MSRACSGSSLPLPLFELEPTPAVGGKAHSLVPSAQPSRKYAQPTPSVEGKALSYVPTSQPRHEDAKPEGVAGLKRDNSTTHAIAGSWFRIDENTRIGMMNNPDFVEHLVDLGVDNPARHMGFPSGEMTRAQKCIHPVVLRRTSTTTGEVEKVTMPCNSPNHHKCPECAEFQGRLRQRQIMNGFERIEEGTRVGLLTLTAPSWGSIHSPAYKKKQVKNPQVEALHARERDIHLDKLLVKGKSCKCGTKHHYIDNKVGLPIDPSTYNYVGEVIWSKMLPDLVHSTTKKLKRMLEDAGALKQDCGFFGVFERQRRGSLHLHLLIVVRGHSDAFDAVQHQLDGSSKLWSSPTAVIPDELHTWLKSDAVSQRWEEDALLPHTDVASSVPTARWKGQRKAPAVTWGKVRDFREVTPTKNLDDEGDGNGWKQVAGYVSKYLTKSQGSMSVEAIKELPFEAGLHFRRLRRAAMALLADYTSVKSVLDALYKETNTKISEIADLRDILTAFKSPEGTYPSSSNVVSDVRYLKTVIKSIDAEKRELSTLDQYDADAILARIHQLEAVQSEIHEELEHVSYLAEQLHKLEETEREVAALLSLTEEWKRRVTTPALQPPISSVLAVRGGAVSRQALCAASSSVGERAAARGLAIRLNKLADNAGFTGSLTSVSNWGTTLTQLKEEMLEFAKSEGLIQVEEDTFEWELDVEAMREAAMKRIPFQMRHEMDNLINYAQVTEMLSLRGYTRIEEGPATG